MWASTSCGTFVYQQWYTAGHADVIAKRCGEDCEKIAKRCGEDCEKIAKRLRKDCGKIAQRLREDTVVNRMRW